MRPLPTACLLLLSLLPGPGRAQSAGPFQLLKTGSLRAQVPLQVQRNLLIVGVWLNGAGPYNFLLDTGVATSIITVPALADSLLLPQGQQFRVVGAGGESTGLLAYETRVHSLRVTGAAATDLPVLVLSEDVLNLSGYVGVPVHGILGSELFRSFVVDMQPGQTRLLLHTPAAFRAPRGRRWTALPLRLEQNKAYLTVPVQQADTLLSLRLVLDTGAGHALSLETDSDPRLHLPAQRLAAQLGQGLTGPVRGHLGRVAAVQLGRYRVPSVLTSYPAAADVGQRATVPRNGNLGYEMLKRFNSIIDYPHQRLWLRPGGSFREPFEHDMSGLELLATGPDYRRYLVLRVVPGSPAAAAGLLADEELLAINLLPVSTLTLTQLSRLLHSGDGHLLHLLLRQSDGELRATTLRLKRQI